LTCSGSADANVGVVCFRRGFSVRAPIF
jgi:hypothetical protein